MPPHLPGLPVLLVVDCQRIGDSRQTQVRVKRLHAAPLSRLAHQSQVGHDVRPGAGIAFDYAGSVNPREHRCRFVRVAQPVLERLEIQEGKTVIHRIPVDVNAGDVPSRGIGPEGAVILLPHRPAQLGQCRNIIQICSAQHPVDADHCLPVLSQQVLPVART